MTLLIGPDAAFIWMETVLAEFIRKGIVLGNRARWEVSLLKGPDTVFIQK